MQKPISIPVVAAPAAQRSPATCSDAYVDCDCSTCPGPRVEPEDTEPAAAEQAPPQDLSLLNPTLIAQPVALYELLRGSFDTPLARGILAFLRDRHAPVWARLLAWHFGYAVYSNEGLAPRGTPHAYFVSPPTDNPAAPCPAAVFLREDDAYAALMEEALLGDFYESTRANASPMVMFMAAAAGFTAVDIQVPHTSEESRKVQAFWSAVANEEAADVNRILQRATHIRAPDDRKVDSWLRPRAAFDDYADEPVVPTLLARSRETFSAFCRALANAFRTNPTDAMPRVS